MLKDDRLKTEQHGIDKAISKAPLPFNDFAAKIRQMVFEIFFDSCQMLIIQDSRDLWNAGGGFSLIERSADFEDRPVEGHRNNLSILTTSRLCNREGSCAFWKKVPLRLAEYKYETDYHILMGHLPSFSVHVQIVENYPLRHNYAFQWSCFPALKTLKLVSLRRLSGNTPTQEETSLDYANDLISLTQRNPSTAIEITAGSFVHEGTTCIKLTVGPFQDPND